MNGPTWIWIPGVAYLVLTAVLRVRFGALAVKQGSRQLHVALLVLAVSAVLDALLRWAAPGWADAWARPRAAWMVFWIAVAGVAMVERVIRVAFALLGRALHVDDLLVSIIRGAVLLALFFIVLKRGLGVNISPLLASTALLTAVVGFALQGVLGNLLAGMSMRIVRSHHKGDWVALGELSGQVVDVNWRETRLRATTGQLHIIPNAQMASAVVTNYSQPDPVRRHELFAVADFRHGPGEVAEAMTAAARAHPEVLAEPAPAVHAVEFRDWGVRYRMFYWTREYQREKTLSGELGNRVWYEFQRHGIRIPFPAGAEGQLAATWARQAASGTTPPEDDPAARVAELLQSPFGRAYLTDERGEPLIRRDEAASVGRALKRLCYGPGEILWRQGDPGASGGVLLRGRLSGESVQGEGAERTASAFELSPGSLFGEMGLMNGQPRMATLRALTHCEVLEISEDAFRAILGLHPDLPPRLADLIAERLAQNDAKRVRTGMSQSTTPTSETLLKRFLKLLAGA